MAFLKEFKEFALKGNVMDMAVGVIIGGAFGKIVSSLVNDILMPPIGALIGNTDFSQLRLDISKFRDMTSSAVHAVGDVVTGGGEAAAKAAAEPVYWNYGAFIQQCIDFTILAFCVFLMVKLMNRLMRKKEEAAAPAPAPEPAPTKEELLLTEIRDLLNEYDFPGDDTPIIQGSALKALEDPAGPWGDKIMELMDAVDSWIPDPQRDTDKDFIMPVEDVFTITGRGTVATGRVEAGVLHLNEEVEIAGLKEETKKTVVTGIEMFRKLLDEAQAGDNIGALLRGVQRTEIERGQVLAKPGTVHCHTKFTAQVYVLTKDEGGRHTPFFNNYRPQFYFRTTDVTGVITLPEGTEMCMPGDNVEMTIELIHPIAMDQGLTFAIREGGRTVGSGRVATLID